MYETFEHTADIGLRIRATTLPELFADAAKGLFSVMVAPKDVVQTTQEVAFRLSADDLESLFHDWLTELLYTFHTRRVVLSEFAVQLNEATEGGRTRSRSAHPAELTATVRGEPIDLGRHQIEDEVKAITWHGLTVERHPNGWLAEVIVDI
jgi:SHS2 domain-containing protein